MIIGPEWKKNLLLIRDISYKNVIAYELLHRILLNLRFDIMEEIILWWHALFYA